MRGFFYLLVGAALVASAGCVALEGAGGVLQSHEAGLKSQSTLDSGPVDVSPARRAQLAGGASGPANEPELTEQTPVEVDVPTEVETPIDVAVEVESAPPASESTPAPAPVVVEGEEPGEASAPVPADVPADLPAEVTAPDSSAPEATAGDSLVPPAPASDDEAVAALDALPRRPARRAPTPSFGEDPSASSERCVPQERLSSTPLTQLSMVGWDSEHGRPLATLATPSGMEFQVEVGDRVGPRGGLVVAIDTGKVTVYELRLDDRETATKVREVIKLRP